MTYRAIAIAAVALTAACQSTPRVVSPTPPSWLEGVTIDQARQNAPDAQQIGPVKKAVALGVDDRTDWHLQLRPGSCYWFSAAGDRDVETLALFLWNDGGKRLETVRGTGPRAVLAHCAASPGMYKLQAKVTRGFGHYQVAMFATPSPEDPIEPSVPPPPIPSPADPPGATMDPPPPAEDLGRGRGPALPESLGGAIDDLARQEAPDSKRVGEPFEGKGAQTDWYLQLDADKCYWLIGAGDGTVAELHLSLWDPKGQRIAVNAPGTNRVRIGHCPTVTGLYHFQAKVARGAGKYQVGVYAKSK
jgi:hypothetical protein